MPILHTVNKSPYERNSLDSAISHALKGSSVILYEDGVYGAMKGTAHADKVSGAMKDVSFYVLGPDLKARGIDENKLIDGVKVVDYSGFVQLTVDNDKVGAWT